MKKPVKVIALVLGILCIAITTSFAQDTPSVQEPRPFVMISNQTPAPAVEGPKQLKPIEVTVVESKQPEETESKEEKEAKRVVTKTVNENTQDVTSAITTQAAITFTYIPNQIYKVYCKEQHITDIQLQPGEQIIFIGGGDTARWIIDQEKSGTGDSIQHHIYVKSLKGDLKTNLIINTDRHVYHLQLQSGNWYTPIVSWVYPQEERAAFLRKQQEAQKVEDETTTTFAAETANFEYKIKGRNYSWKPKMVFDDGLKTYIQMPETMATGEAPALFIKNGKELQLVNYRVKNNYYIVDRIFKEAELRCGLKETVRIIKKGVQ